MARVYFTPNSLKKFQGIENQKFKTRIGIAIQKLTQNPIAGKKLKGELYGQYSLRIWPWRITYFIKSNKDVIITDIGHRKDVYR